MGNRPIKSCEEGTKIHVEEVSILDRQTLFRGRCFAFAIIHDGIWENKFGNADPQFLEIFTIKSHRRNQTRIECGRTAWQNSAPAPPDPSGGHPCPPTRENRIPRHAVGFNKLGSPSVRHAQIGNPSYVAVNDQLTVTTLERRFERNKFHSTGHGTSSMLRRTEPEKLNTAPPYHANSLLHSGELKKQTYDCIQIAIHSRQGFSACGSRCSNAGGIFLSWRISGSR